MARKWMYGGGVRGGIVQSGNREDWGRDRGELGQRQRGAGAETEGSHSRNREETVIINIP